MRRYFCAKKLQTCNVRTKKLQAKLSNEKDTRQMLVKLTKGVNFTNISRPAFAPIFLHQKSKNNKFTYNNF